ncbi:farnesol dehydrogenase-like [Zophobas morio]|uniref:farnesol dehydrogenase-like n=1 Tax=Zophobas morio TaxID=2755281 RepID=UPI003082E9ED
MVLSIAKWVGKVAVVTGASSGIGAAIVDRLIEKGVIVVGIARRVELIEKRAKSCTVKEKLYAVKADITKEDQILKALKWVEDNVGPIHVLINSAGVILLKGLTETSTEDMKTILELNVLGLSIITREVVKMMQAHKISGHIIHINSTFGHQVMSHAFSIYPASKFAVTALTETLRQELNSLGLKIKVTSVSPGLVATEMTTLNKDILPEAKEMFDKIAILQPADVVDAVVYALSTPEHVQVHELTLTGL